MLIARTGKCLRRVRNSDYIEQFILMVLALEVKSPLFDLEQIIGLSVLIGTFSNSQISDRHKPSDELEFGLGRIIQFGVTRP